jgi:hypothetical protein
VVLAEFAGFQRVAADSDQRVVLTLGQAALIGVDLVLRRRAGEAGLSSSG